MSSCSKRVHFSMAAIVSRDGEVRQVLRIEWCCSHTSSSVPQTACMNYTAVADPQRRRHARRACKEVPKLELKATLSERAAMPASSCVGLMSVSTSRSGHCKRTLPKVIAANWYLPAGLPSRRIFPPSYSNSATFHCSYYDVYTKKASSSWATLPRRHWQHG